MNAAIVVMSNVNYNVIATLLVAVTFCELTELRYTTLTSFPLTFFLYLAYFVMF